MKPIRTLEEAVLPEGVPVHLTEHDGAVALHSEGVQLQSTQTSFPREELGRLASAPFKPTRQPRLLIGGLGLGHSLATIQSELPQKRASFLVAEPLRTMVAWHRDHLTSLHPGQLEDSRVAIHCRSLPATLRKNQGEGFHAIVIDWAGGYALDEVVDAAQRPSPAFLSRAHAGLKEGGLLAICSTGDHSTFEQRLIRAGFVVARESVPASHKGKQKRRFTIWLARKGTYQKKTEPRPTHRSPR